MCGERGIAVVRCWKCMRKRIPGFPTKVTIRVLLLLLFCASLSICCFRYLMQWQTWTYFQLLEGGFLGYDPEKIMQEISEKAKNITFHELSQKQLEEILDLQKYDDGYTYFSFYDAQSGDFQFRTIASVDWNHFDNTIFWYHDVAYNSGMDYMEFVDFADTTEQIIIYSMHQAKIVIPYFFIVFFISIMCLLPVPVYIWGRMRYVRRIKDEIQVMADGDLEHPITVKGQDELGILAKNLDGMRVALEENIRKEQEGQRANQELIRSLSHDLRTPLTTLYGYLEILEQNKCSQEKQIDYLARCITKVEEIRILSDKMFEYAFVYGKEEGVELTEIYLEELLEELEQNREFLELKGFSVQTEFLAEEGKIMGHVMFFQRIFSNLFTNILKYADQDQSIVWTVKVDRGMLCFLFWNHKLRSRKLVESNGIGLKSVRRMVELQNGSIFMTEDGEHFALTMKFPLI